VQYLSPDDVALLTELDALGATLSAVGLDELGQRTAELRRRVAERLRRLVAETRELAEVNARTGELLEKVEAFGREVHAQNAALRRHTQQLEMSQRETSRVVQALADANAAAAVTLAEADEMCAEAQAARHAVLAEREAIAREAEELRLQTAALADANVEMLMLAEERAEHVEALRAQCARERAEKLAYREQAFVDRLTGLYNRRYYDEHVEVEHARAIELDRPLSIVFIDIDHFKVFNDTHGHAAGDRLLTRVARLISDAVMMELPSRQDGTSFAARYGGEEFLLVLPEVDAARARRIAERLQGVVLCTEFAGAERQPGGRLTVSAGVATRSPADASGAEVARRADVALYRAKATGRNRVVIADASSEPARATRRSAASVPPA